MDVPATAATIENEDSHNVIALHLRITAPEQASLLVTGNSTKSTRQSLNMSRSTLSNRLSAGVAGSRMRSASTGRDKKSDLRARHWAFLFENLQHAIDELYQTCEMDENISECKEVILVLENYTRDFHNLAEWFRLKWEYENTPPPQRPNSLTWEIRKSSPGKIFRKNSQAKFDGGACRELIFELDKGSKTTETTGVANGVSKSAANVEPNIPVSNVASVHRSISQHMGGVAKPKNIDCGCQTEDDTQSKKTLQTNCRRVASNSSSFKKPLNFSIRSAPDRNTPLPSTLPLRRLTPCTSPRKSVPGRNVAAPIFEPGKRIVAALKTVPLLTTPETNDNDPGTKLLISRSQSDSIFETSSTLSWSKSTGKPYASIECVNRDIGDDGCLKSPTVESMRVISEGVVVSPQGKSAGLNDVTLISGFSDTDQQHLPSKNIQCQSLAKHIDAHVNNGGLLVNVEPMLAGMSDAKQDANSSSVADNQKHAESMSVASFQSTSPNSSSAKPSETVLKQPTLVSSVVTRASPSVGETENSFPKTIVTPKKMLSEDKKSLLSSADAVKKIDTKKTVSPRSNLMPRPAAGCPLDPKLQQRPNVAERKTNFAARFPPTRLGNHKYVKNGVPKTVTATAATAAAGNLACASSDKGDQRKVDQSSVMSSTSSRIATKEVTQCVSKSSDSVRSISAKTETNRAAVPANYSNVTKSNKEILSVVCRANQLQAAKCTANIVRSKTSIDMKAQSRVAPLKHVNAVASSSPTKIFVENRDQPARSRRSSKDSDGWETVISRSRRSIPNSLNGGKDKPKTTATLFDINKRFYEPTPSSSLPSLAVVDGDIASVAVTKEKSPDSAKWDKGSKLRNRNNSQGSCNSKEGTERGSGADFSHYKLNKERPIISSTAMFTTISSKRKKSNEKEAKKSKYAGNHGNNNSTGNNGNGKRKLNKESDNTVANDFNAEEESLRRSKELHEEEISLQEEIDKLQNADAETNVDDSDSAEVDPEIVELCQRKGRTPVERRALLEQKYSHVLSNMSWAEQIETLDKLEELLERDPSGQSLRFAKNFTSLKQFEDLVARWPGRALELHQKLSSPSRKRISPDSTIMQQKAKQAKAKRNREQLLQDKSTKIKELFNKVAELKAMQASLAEERRRSLDQKLKRAEENRNLHLKSIQEKAHDEAKKLKEIAFINELEAQNKRHDFFVLRQEQEERLQSILEERQRRHEEKAAKEAAVEERRKAIEAERQEKIEELQEKMRKREERIDREFQEKERERIKMAREKARDREDRLLALQAAQIANTEELQKKIQQKQEDSARRHEESIELIRQRAIEIGTPRLTPYQVNKLCSVCNVVIDSEVFLLSHLKGSSHQEAVKKYREQFEASVKFSECSIIKDAPAEVVNEKKSREIERQKTLRKRCKKIRQRLNLRSDKYLKNISEKDQNKKIDTPDRRRIFKAIKEIEKLFGSQGSGMWPNNAVTMLERNLFEIIRILDKGEKGNQQSFREFDGFAVLSKIYNMALDLPKNMSPYLPLKCFLVASNAYINACSKNVDNCVYVLLSNRIVQILEFLMNRLNLIMPNSDDRNGMVVYKADSVADVLMKLCSLILANVTSLSKSNIEESSCHCEDIELQLQDVVSYTVCTGIVDKLAVYCSSVHDNKSADSIFLLHSIELLTQLVETRKGKISDKEDSTQLMVTLKATELVGAVSMLYAILLHQDSMSNDAPSNDMVLQSAVVNVIIATLRLFSRVCELNLEFFQNILGAEGISLQVRHIISYLLKYCVQNEDYPDLLHQVIEFIGFFAIHHRDNQMILQSGSTPTVLQQLSNLPFEYFSNPKLVCILFPTLLACCVDNMQNRLILDQEMSFQLLEDFRNSDASKDIPLMKLLR